MPSASDEAFAIARAAAPSEDEIDWDLYQKEYERALAERHEQLLHEARGIFRAMDGWPMVKDREGWRETVRKAAEDLEHGGFLIERLGAERYLDPPLMAALLILRRRLIDEHGAATAAELLLVDSAVLAYYQQLRVNGWLGDLAQLVEAEFFRKEPPTARLEAHYGAGRVRGLQVEEAVGRMAERLMPLLDRSNRMLIRNLKALRAMRQGPAPSVSIGSAAQVNVAGQQLNAATDARPEE
jgi:hypothetical protein